MPWNVRIKWHLLAQWTLQNNSLVFLFCNWIIFFTECDTSTNSDYVLYTCALNTVSTIPKICCYSWNYSGTSHKRLPLMPDLWEVVAQGGSTILPKHFSYVFYFLGLITSFKTKCPATACATKLSELKTNQKLFLVCESHGSHWHWGTRGINYKLQPGHWRWLGLAQSENRTLSNVCCV